MPSSKYHAHRALILASLAEGETRIVGILGGPPRAVDDRGPARGSAPRSRQTADGFRGPRRPLPADLRDEVSVGSSGTTLYFMLGLASLADAPVTITGQKYFQRRPVGAAAGGARRRSGSSSPRQRRDAAVHGRARGARAAAGCAIAGTLSQWISGDPPRRPVRHRADRARGRGRAERAPLRRADREDDAPVRARGRGLRRLAPLRDRARARPRGRPRSRCRPTSARPPSASPPARCTPPTSPSPACTRPRRRRSTTPRPSSSTWSPRWGCRWSSTSAGRCASATTAAPLRGVEIDCRPMPDMLPVLTTIAQFAEGETRFRNVEHVRLKESDRVVSMLQLNRMGGDVEIRDDELVVARAGRAADRRPALLLQRPPRAHGAGRRRLPGARARARSPTRNAYRISYPEFLDDMRAIGLDLGDRGRRARRRRRAPERGARAGGGPEAVESVAIDQAAEVPIVDWVGALGARAARRARGGRRAGGRHPALDLAELRATRPTRVAALLLELGVEPGETVAYQLPNWGEFAILTLAAAKIGAVGCALMPIFREREIAHAAASARGARVLRDRRPLPRPRRTWRRPRRCSRGGRAGRSRSSTCSSSAPTARRALPADGRVALARLRAAAATQRPTREAIARAASRRRRARPALLHLRHLGRAEGRRAPLRRARPARP